MEEAVELGIPWGLLAVGNLEAVRRVARLLGEYLRKLDHVWIVLEFLGEIDHVVSLVLLVAVLAGSKKRSEGCLRDGRTLALATSLGLRRRESAIA